MIKGLVLRLWRGEEILNDKAWRRCCNRVIVVVAVVAGLCTVQTMLIYSPAFLVDALYHGRQYGALNVRAMPKDQRDRLLFRMCWVKQLYSMPHYIDQYTIEKPEECRRPE